MAIDIKNLVETIVIVMLENRSFDHMLGYLSLKEGTNRTDVDGIADPATAAYINDSAGETYSLFPMKDAALPGDLPHGRALVDVQLAKSPASGKHEMTGAVEAYRQFMKVRRVKTKAPPMGFMKDGKQVPTLDFFAKNFTVCDHWFAPLPSDTHPNRLMALSGFTTVDRTVAHTLDQELVYEWLTKKEIRWRVYRSGPPFCILFPRMWDKILDNTLFRSIRHLAKDVQTESDHTYPEVIFCEPAYLDWPIGSAFERNDDHPPLPAGPGQRFLREIYEALTANPARWAKTMMIVTYDEHGGFFDHVPPLLIPTDPPPGENYRRFETTGARVPGLIVSPLVAPASAYKKPLDHTSILQFLAQMFGDGDYSADVRRRQDAGINSVSDALTLSEPRAVVVAMPPLEALGIAAVVPVPRPEDRTPNQIAFETAARGLLASNRTKALDSYPELATLKPHQS
jgi:phospholipase C